MQPYGGAMRRTTLVVLSCSFLAVAMAAVGCTSDVKSDGAKASDSTKPKATTTLAPSTTTVPAKGSAASLQLRPVVGSQLCSSVKPDAPDETTTTTTVETKGKTKGSTTTTTSTTTTSTAPPPITGAPDLVPDHDGVTCYGLGPAGGTGEDLEHAKVAPGPEGEWVVTTRVRDASRSKLSNLFDACYRNEPFCEAPDSASGHGRLAFVLDDEVVSAPTVQALGLALGDIQISGGFTKPQAEDLAALIDS
jgi:hypothetical protein